MSCKKHFLNLEYEHHKWHRRVCGEETLRSPETDMWGRKLTTAHVRCHTQEVCTECGATRELGECFCDPDEAAKCPPRLTWIENHAKG